MLLTFLLVAQGTTVSAQGVDKAVLTPCSDPKAPGAVWQDGCIVKTCKSGAVEETLADECVELIEKIVEEKLEEKLAEKGPSYLYIDSTTILDMNTLQVIPCQQAFPGKLDMYWSQAAVVPYNGHDVLMVCGGRHMTKCFVWTSSSSSSSSSGWQTLNTTLFNKRFGAASSMIAGGLWLVTGGFRNGHGLLPSILLYGDNHWEEFDNIPLGLNEHCQVTVEGIVYIIGGASYNSEALSRVYKLIDHTWTKYDSINTARKYHMCAVLDNTVYVIGGSVDVGSTLNSVEVLAPDSDGWVYGPSLPENVYSGQSVVYQGVLYVINWNGKIYRLDRGVDQWLTEGSILDHRIRSVFPAPLLTEDQLPCIE